MLYVLLGSLSFAPLYIYDKLKLQGRSRWASIAFLLGSGLVLACTFAAFFSGEPRFVLHPALMVVFGVFTMIFACTLIWSVLFTLPFRQTYVEGISGVVSDTGLYALCRHPSVLFFAGMYLCIWIISGRDTMLVCAVVLTLSDLIRAYVQDRRYFPASIAGYAEYCEAVPFLIPTGASLRRCFETLSRPFEKKR